MAQPNVQPSDDLGALVEAAKQGDATAFGTLVEIYQHEVYTLAMRLVGDPSLAQDVAQESFLRAWRGLPRFRGDAALSTWLYRITVNTAHTATRRRRREVPVGELELDRADPHVDVEAAGQITHLRSTLRRALAELPDGHRAVVVLKDVYDWPHARVARALGLSVTATKVRLHRARRRLRDMLSEER